MALSHKETSSSKRGSLQQARQASVYECEGKNARKDLKNHLLYQLIAPEILHLGFWSFDVKPFFFFCHNVSGRYVVKLQYHPINFRTFSYAYLAGKENKENKIERNKLSQCINHKSWHECVPRMIVSSSWDFTVFCIICYFL